MSTSESDSRAAVEATCRQVKSATAIGRSDATRSRGDASPASGASGTGQSPGLPFSQTRTEPRKSNRGGEVATTSADRSTTPTNRGSDRDAEPGPAGTV